MTARITYDLVFSSPYTSYEYFAHTIRQLCGQMRLNFFLVNDVWVDEFLAKVDAGEVQAKVLLNFTTTDQVRPDDPYTQIARQLKEQGCYLIDDPDHAVPSSHKGDFHRALEAQGVPVPATIVLKGDEIDDFKLTDEIKRRIGVPFVVKPARGFGGFGVIVDGDSEEHVQRCAVECPQADTLLVQQRLTLQDLGRHKGWFRLFYVCGTVIACWWDPVSHEYHLVKPSQMEKYNLGPLRAIMQRIAEISNMKKFSSEICLHEDGTLYAVDYMNTCPDMNPQSFYDNGVPDEVVRHIAWLLFYEAMLRVRQDQGFFDADLLESDEQWYKDAVGERAGKQD